MEGFNWLYPPASFEFIGTNGVRIVTLEKTDFWQRTFYGFRNDNGHFLHRLVKGDFVLRAECHFNSDTLYDQCGLLARIDEDNWIKASCEYETAEISHLGSVITNLGYSDWSKQEIPASIHVISYKMERRGSDFFVSVATDGATFKEIRVGHLHKNADEMMVGVYACSPQRAGFQCEIHKIEITQ
jgi:regulation of enolase protein 1 (concanavalin A-like superfamily)